MPRTRLRIASIPEDSAPMFRQLGIQEGAVVEAPDGFPPAPDLAEPTPGVRLTHELHPNAAWFLGGAIREGLIEVEAVEVQALEGAEEVAHAEG